MTKYQLHIFISIKYFISSKFYKAFATDRNRTDIGFHFDAEVNEMLVQLDNAFKNGILVIAETNYINKIDTSVFKPGHIDKKLEIREAEEGSLIIHPRFLFPPKLNIFVWFIKI